MADDSGRACQLGQAGVLSDRWGLLILAAGFVAGAAIGLGLPALIAYQLRADPVEIPGEWLTTAPATGDASSIGKGRPPRRQTPG